MRSPILTQKRAKALRKAMTQPERELWALLRENAPGFHFRRQHAVGPFILDFYCASAKLGVEVDGPVHDGQVDRDARRTAWLAASGIRVIRFSVAAVFERPAEVLAEIAQAAAPSTA
jgi:very-short-patch-repair endonuclease